MKDKPAIQDLKEAVFEAEDLAEIDSGIEDREGQKHP